jgi:hypothetical protein
MRFTVLAGLVAATLAAPAAALTSLNFVFDNTPDSTVVAPIVGTGNFTTPDTLGLGDFALSSLSSFTFSFTFGGVTFDQADLATPLGNVIVRISQNGPMTMLTFGGSRGGPFGGSIDFVDGANQLSFQPDFGVLYFMNGGGSNFFGTFAAQPTGTTVPEPASWAMLIAGFGLVGAVARRRRLRFA